MVKQRNSNFELMRIISMFFIVLFHMIISTGGNLINNTEGLTKIALEFICMIIIVHVNSYILASGYFQHDKKISIKKIFSLAFMAWFYKIIIALIMYANNLHSFTALEIIKIISPLEYQNNWFLVVYLSMYIMSPYINILIKKLSQVEHRKLIIIMFIIFSIIATITNQNTFQNTGFSLIHFIYLYIVGAYLKKYPLKDNIHFKNYNKVKIRLILLTIFIFLGTFNFLLYEFSNQIKNITSTNTLNYHANLILTNLFYYQNPILIIQTICYFLFFETLSFQSKIINKVASLIFAVYIIHENPFIMKYMYKILKINTGYIHTSSILFKMTIATIIVMTICLVIEFIRVEIFNALKKIFKNILAKCKVNSIDLVNEKYN